MAVSGIYGRANLLHLELLLDVPDEIYDGVETMVTLRVRNGRRRLPAFLLKVVLQERSFSVRLLDPGSASAGAIPAVFRGRGAATIETAKVFSPFPVNFFVRCAPLPLDRSIVVFPAPRPCAPEGEGGRGRVQGEATDRGRGEEGDLRRIADYTGQEPLKRIHWKHSARQGALKVKEMSTVTSEPVILDLEHLPGIGLEEKLGSGVFLVNRLVRENRPVGLRLGKKFIPAGRSRGHRLRLLRELALHDPA